MSYPTAIVLAAGKGTRMKSDLPKVLVEINGRPMIEYVLDALTEGGIERTIVVVGYRAQMVRTALQGRPGIEFALQVEQLGTGHAAMACRDALGDFDGPVLIVTGDQPLMQAKSIRALLRNYEETPTSCILGTAIKDNPFGLGRIIRDENGKFLGIVEEKDATDEQRKIKEVNMSYYVFNCRDMIPALEDIQANNVQAEYYLTDCPGILAAAGKEVRALDVLAPYESIGINTVDELAVAEAAMAELRR